MTFRQSYLETVVGIFGKLVGRIADERDALDVTHDEDDPRRGCGLLLQPLGYFLFAARDSSHQGIKGRLFGMKTHLLGNVGKGPGQFHQGHAGLLFRGFLLAHGWMTTGTSALLFFLGWGP